MKALLLVVLILAACETTPPVTPADRTRIYSAAQAQVFDAAKRVLMDIGADITTSDAAGGILNGRVRLREMVTFMTGQGMYWHYKIALMSSGSGTEARASIYLAYADDSHHTEGASSYTGFWERVEKYLK